MTETPKPRWIYRFENFTRAFALLQEAVETKQHRALSMLEAEGLIQRFEYTWELAWNVLADYLDHAGAAVTSRTPRMVLRAAFETALITEGDTWMRALDARNRMSHTYDKGVFDQVVAEIERDFFPRLSDMHAAFAARVAGGADD